MVVLTALFLAGAVAAIVWIERSLPPPNQRLSLILLVATAVYLTFEVGFNARLLDVAGRAGNDEAIAGLEQWGRIISGIAVALAFWGLLGQFACRQGKAWPPLLLAGAMIGSALIIVPAVYQIEKLIVDAGAGGTSRNRQIALQSVSMARYLHGFSYPDEIAPRNPIPATPEGRAFYALLPSFYRSVITTSNDLPLAETAVRDQVERRLGSAEETYRDIYVATLRDLRSSYNEAYARGANAYADAIENAPARSSEAWQRYVRQISGRGWQPETVPWRNVPAVRSQVEDSLGIVLPPSWQPTDQASLESAVQNRVFQQADTDWHRRNSEFDEPLPATLTTFPEFLASAPVQRALRTELRLPEGPDTISARWSAADWSEKWHQPLVQQQVSAIITTRSSFDIDGVNYCRGLRAVRATTIPAFAMTVSIAGAFYHLSKVVWYLCLLAPFLRSWPIRWTIRAVLLGALIVAPLSTRQTFAIVGSPQYEQLLAHKRADEAWSTDWIIRAQQLYYGWNAFAHRALLGGYAFPAPFSAEPLCSLEAPVPAPTAQMATGLFRDWQGAIVQPDGQRRPDGYWIDGYRLVAELFPIPDGSGRFTAIVSFPDLQCRGVWEPFDDNGQTRLIQRISGEVCEPLAYIEDLRLDGDRMVFSLRRPDRDAAYATGVLQRGRFEMSRPRTWARFENPLTSLGRRFRPYFDRPGGGPEIITVTARQSARPMLSPPGDIPAQ